MNSVFIRQMRAEKLKARNKKAVLVPLGFLAFDFLWAIWQVSSMDPGELPDGYMMFFYQLPTMNVILLPLMISVIASRICDMEVKGDTMKLLFTLQKRTGFFDCKYLTCMKYLLVFVAGQGIMLPVLGNVYHFGRLKLSLLFLHMLVTLAVSAVILCIQQFLYLLSENQLLPLAVGIAGCFLGLFSMFFPAPVARLVLWGYYAVFACVGMDWDADINKILGYYEIPFPTVSFLLFLAAGAVLYLICRAIIIKKEV